MKAQISQISKVPGMDEYFISLFTKEPPPAFLQDMGDKGISVEFKRLCSGRSKNANAYFHVLLGKIADKSGVSKPFQKNLLLARYGQREITESGIVQIIAPAEADLLEREDIHLAVTGYEGDWVQYDVIRPSHTYNQQEMAALIGGAVAEAKKLGIETMTPDELERMLSVWKATQGG